MEPVSRRLFFKQAGAAAATVVVAGSVVSPLALGVASAGASTAEPRTHEEPLAPEEELASNEGLVAQITNSRTGEISLYIGHRQVTIHDRQVAARLIRATR